MSEAESVLCPICGWSGAKSDLSQEQGAYHCPACSESVRVE